MTRISRGSRAPFSLLKVANRVPTISARLIDMEARLEDLISFSRACRYQTIPIKQNNVASCAIRCTTYSVVDTIYGCSSQNAHASTAIHCACRSGTDLKLRNNNNEAQHSNRPQRTWINKLVFLNHGA